MADSGSLTRRTARSLSWMVFAAAAQGGLQLVVFSVLARMLDAASFGLIAAALTIVSFSSVVSQMGVGPALVQLPVLRETHVRTAFTTSLMLGGFLTAAVYLTAGMVEVLFQLDGLSPLLRALAAVFFFEGLSTVSENLLQRELRFRAVATVGLISYGLGYGAVGVTLAALDFGLWSLVWANLARSVLKAAGMLVAQPHGKVPSLDVRALRELFTFGAGFTGARIANYVALQGDYFVIGRWLGAIALGLYERAYRLMTMPVSLLGQALEKVLFAAMSRVQGDTPRLRVALERSTASMALLVFPVSVLTIVLAPELVAVVLGDGWDAVVSPFQVLASGLVFRIGYKLSNALALARGAVYSRAWREVVYAAVVLLGAWGGTRWGILGVSGAVVAAMTLNWVLMTQLALRLVGGVWMDFFVAHMPGATLGLATATVGWPMASLLRAADTGAIAVLATTSLSCVALSLLVIWGFQHRVLGPHGPWMLRTWGSIWSRRGSR